MQAGIVYGQIGQAKYIIDKMKEECDYENVKVVASGGLGKIIYEKDKNKKVAMASLTKMMSQIIILEEIENNKIKVVWLPKKGEYYEKN